MSQEENTRRECSNIGSEDRLIAFARRAIRHAVRALAVLMVFVIWWGVADVIYVLYSRIGSHPLYLLEIRDIFATFGAFMAVLIAVEVFANIVSYLKDEGLQLEIVMATAYMAVLRKIVILDYKEVSPDYVIATAALALALAIGYWVTIKYPCRLASTHAKNSTLSE